MDQAARHSDQRLRIGFISENFGNHIIARTSMGMMKHLPRDRYDITAIHILKSAHDLTSVEEHADRTLRLKKTSLDRVREQIAGLELDALAYIDIGLDAFTYLLAFSRLAPVQFVFGGHPDTTGIPNMDYFVSTEVYDGADAQKDYTEKLIRLRNINAYLPPPPLAEMVPANLKQRLGLPQTARIYACPVSLFKFHPDFDDAIIRILEQDADGVFGVFEAVQAAEVHFLPALEHRIYTKAPHLTGRMVVIPRMKLGPFLGALAEVDACLDSFHFGAGTTALFGFGAGIPIITLPGKHLRNRSTAGYYRLMEIQDPIADDVSDFVNKALRLAHDRTWYDSIRQRLLERSAVLFHQTAFIDEFTAFLDKAVSAKRAGEPLIDWPATPAYGR
jgi:protein O-GlcNAc transferase